ncbi:metalloregulator ArsR/SmtB family transcription factor [Glutamicibacter sp. PS]|uniref:ArsR/SmtB family transcription factor n=1 Tax=Glutamicibacter sp. PS TaxID=3075634 RepID=UPI002847C262|nr:metalloregulator ArsR/SmtB family transcription factor [Glutamicibacter sp. PS]MDR4534794.1 metalloregulator ArsR/SmtB family transcription factor [Glutamicibacter sp. PS]
MSIEAARLSEERICAGKIDAEQAPCCVPAQGEDALPAEEAEVLAARFKALADPHRLRILSIVSSSDTAETCVCDLSEPLGLRQPTVSHHLKILVEAGLLHREKRGVWAYFSLVPGALDSLAASLTAKERP